MTDVLSQRALNRATLARQLLLQRSPLTVEGAIRHLFALQAQDPKAPFTALWTRLSLFERSDLVRLVADYTLVRCTWARGTLHLLAADDYRSLRTTLQPSLTSIGGTMMRTATRDVELRDLLDHARRFFGQRPATFDAYRAGLQPDIPRASADARSITVRLHLPLIQQPDGGPWGYAGVAPFGLAEACLGAVDTEHRPAEMIRRYLAAFGPGTTPDMQKWLGMRGLTKIVHEMRDELVTFRDESGRTLYDLLDAPRPDPETPAPVRLLGEFDNLLLAYADGGRVVSEDVRRRLMTVNGRVLATFLVDGVMSGTWRTERTKTAARLTIEPFTALRSGAKDELAAEGDSLVRFLDPDAQSVSIRFQEQ